MLVVPPTALQDPEMFAVNKQFRGWGGGGGGTALGVGGGEQCIYSRMEVPLIAPSLLTDF